MRVRSCLILALLCLCGLTIPAGAVPQKGKAAPGDWPQWRGPNRDDVSLETGLLRSWPSKGPALLWTSEQAGLGYSSPAVVGERIYLMGAQGDSDCLFALDARTGKEVWSTSFASHYQHRYGDGPRGSVTADGERLYGLGGQGQLVCVEAATGTKVWSINLKNDLGGRMMSGWGYSESPLVDGDLLLCSPGGAQGTLAALDKRTGKVVWRSKGLPDAAAYSSIVVAEVGGVRQYVQQTGAGVAGVAARDGRLLWHVARPEYRTAVIPTPIVQGNHVYVTSGYGAGCWLLELSPDGQGGTKAKEVYGNRNMVNHHGGVVRVGDHVYGYSDREGWICQEFLTGKIVWAEKNKLGKGAITCADGHLYCYAERDGTLALIEATPKGWVEKGRFKIPRETTRRSPSGRIWTHPVIAHGRLYLRDQDLFFCFDVSERTASAR